jgi:hypothetical protein
MLSHRLGDALAALEPGDQELVGVGPVDGRTGRAAGFAAGAAGLEQHAIRLPPGVVHGADLAGRPVGVLDAAGQADRVMAVAGLRDQLHPALIALAGPVDDLAEDAGEQLARANRVGHAAPSGAGSGTTRRLGAWSASSAAGSRWSLLVAWMMAATWW